MGPLGVFTRILGAKFGAPFTYAGFNPERTLRPGMLNYQVLKRDYFYDQINAETEVYAVIGDPIEHSLSPAIHNAAFRHLGMNKVLVPLLFPAGKLEESFRAVEWLGIKGFSVTIPHKEDIVPLLSLGRRRRRADGVVQHRGDQGGQGARLQHRLPRGDGVARGRLWGAVRGRPEPPVREAGADRGGGGRRPIDRLRPGPPRRRASPSPTATTTARPPWPRKSAAGPRAGRCAPARSPTSSSTAPRSACTPTWTSRRCPPAAFNTRRPARLRHDLPPREHHVPEAGARARLPDDHRGGHVRRPGGAAVQALHRAGRPDRRRCAML